MGKTHAAGALAAWSLLHPAITRQAFATAQNFEVLAVSLGAAVLGGLLPDIDRPGSTIDRDLLGRLGSSRAGAMLSGLLLLAVSAFLRIPTLVRTVFSAQVMRIMVLRYAGVLSLATGLLGAVLVIVSSLKHRGITHTLLGMGLFLWGADTLLGFSHFLIPWRVPLLMVFGAGYLSHLLLDLIADGVPLLYPVWKKRIRLPVSVKTGSFWDVVVVRLGLVAWLVYAEGLPLIHTLGISL
ncbi:metal-dependent hydrolase [Acididesulfobacillus acetoxydans]|nr:metal-dependent hydrolase [Acididesulfobacillus acetoxydans]